MLPWRRRVRRHVSGTKLFSKIAQLASGLRKMREKTSRFPDLKFKSMPNESDLRGNARISFGAFTEDHTPLRINFQNLAGSNESRRKQITLLRIRGKLTKEIVNFTQKSMPSTIEGFNIKRGVNIKTIKAVSRQHRPKRRWDRNPPLGIEPAGVMRDKSVHSPTPPARVPSGLAAKATGAPRHTIQRLNRDAGEFGITWENLGVNGIAQSLPPKFVKCALLFRFLTFRAARFRSRLCHRRRVARRKTILKFSV